MATTHYTKWYKPMDVAKLGLIQSTAGTNNVQGNYNFILELIKSGKLKAKNVGTGQTPYYLISESEVKRYHQSGK